MRKVHIRNISHSKPFTTKDTSIIRSILDRSNAPVRRVSLAEATLLPGRETEEHVHRCSEEIYFFLKGDGVMTLQGRSVRVRRGDAVLNPAGVRHTLRNDGPGSLVFLCACAPPYGHRDTVITGRRIRLAVFDFDGTLVHSAPGIRAAANVLARELGRRPVTMREVIRTVGRGLDNFLRDIFPEALRSRTLAQISARYRQVYARHALTGLILLPGVRETLKFLKARGILTAIISNKHKPSIDRINRALRIDRYFDAVLGVESLQRRKPDPYPVRFLMKRYGLHRDEVIMVGDSQYDVETGKRAGVRTVFLTGGYADRARVRALRPDHVIGHLREIKKIVTDRTWSAEKDR